MKLKLILIPWILFFQWSPASSKLSRESILKVLSDAKAELAHSFFKRELLNEETPKIVNLTHTSIEELNVTKPGKNVRIFRNAQEQFFFNGVDLLQLQKNKTAEEHYFLRAVDDIRLDEGAVFFKNAEWKQKVFLVICYQRGYCEVRMSSTSSNVVLKMKINTGILPLDVTFFTSEEDFFLVTVQDPVVIYRWTGTYFNKDSHLDTAGAQSVAVFEDRGKSIIVVAQNLGRNKVYSKVYIRQNEKIELFQLLPTNEPLRILPFDIAHREDFLHFVFVLNNAKSSSIFWWTGKEFALWKSLDNIFGQRIIYNGKIGSEVFIFIAEENKIYVYHPTVTSFDLMQIITFDQEVVGIDLRQEKDQMPMLVLLTGSVLDPYFKVNLIYLQVNYMPASVEKHKDADELFQCFSKLEKELDEREIKLEEVYQKVFGESQPATVPVENLKVDSLEDKVMELREKLKNIQERLEVVKKEAEVDRDVRYHVYGDFKIGKMTANVVDADILNGKPPDLENILSLTKNQTISGNVNLKTLIVDKLSVPYLNGVATKDILLRNKDIQRVTGDYTLASLTAKDVRLGSNGALNGIPFEKIVTPHNSENLITGKKIIRKLKAKQVEVEKINNVSSAEWLSKILPSPNSAAEEETLNFTNLSIKKLWVSNLNGIFWDDFVDSVFLPLNNETIKGDLEVEGTTKIENLKTEKINGIPIVQIFGRSVQPNITCRRKPPKKSVKALPIQLSPVWNDSFLKDILNEPYSAYDNDIKYFTGTEEIEGNFRASSVFVKSPMEISDILVEDVENFKDHFWLKSQEQTITEPVNFPNGFSVANSLRVNEINGNSLNEFVWTDRSNFVSSNLVFDDVQIEKNVVLKEGVKQNVNLRKIQEKSVNCNGDNTITGQKHFLGTLTTKNLHVDFLNGIDVRDFNDFMKSKIDADGIEVSELIVYGDIKVEDGVEVNTINGVDFNETISKALTWDDSALLEKVCFQSLTVENLNVDTINGIDIEDKLPKLSKTQDKDVYVVIEGNFELPELNAIKVNGINFDKYINQVYQVNKTKTIRGEKIFKGMVTVTGNLEGTLNDMNVTELERIALSKSKPQVITGTYTAEEFKANDVAAEFIDGVPADRILYQDVPSPQIINSDVVFHNMAVAGDIKAVNFMGGCDLRKITEMNLENLTNFETLEVKGDLTWESNREDPFGLSYFMTNVVTKSGNQVISGPVVFENDVTLGNVSGKRHFNNVDLEFISKDAIYKSLEEQEIMAPVTFKSSVKANSIEIQNNVLLDSINGIDITDFGERLVRKSSAATIKGKKIFKAGFSANRLDAESINGAKTNQIIFYDDFQGNNEIRLPPTIFSKLNVFNDLKVHRVNDYVLDQIFENKFSKTKDQSMQGKLSVEGTVTITGDGNIQRINDVDLEETILTDEEVSAKVITGDIEFRDTISIADNLEVDYINGHNMTAVMEKALMVDEDVIIEGNVEFTTDVTIKGNIDVNEIENTCDLTKFSKMDFGDEEEKTNSQIRNSLKQNLAELKNLTAAVKKSVVFMYLKEMATLDLGLPNIHGSGVNRYNDSVEFNIYGMNFGDCGLPSECYCPTQTNLKIHSLEPFSVEVEANSTRFFKHHDEELGVEVKVSTDTVSYSSRCKRTDEGFVGESTSISWKKLEKDSQEILVRKIFKGFLSDVKFFRLGDSVYIITAFYFHPSRNQTNNLHTIVYELNVKLGKVEKVDVIPSSGAQVLEVFWTTRGVILVIGNSFDSDLFTDSVNSAIYRFNEFENKFELLRFVKTHGVLSIKSMRYKKTSFIFFVQKQTWPMLILKYNQDYDNYYFSQKLDTAQSFVRSNFLSVSVISTITSDYSGDLFIGIVLSDDSFRLFKYKHIEGFVEESYQEQNNVRILHPFWIGSNQYLMAGSASDTSKIYKFVEQGRL